MAAPESVASLSTLRALVLGELEQVEESLEAYLAGAPAVFAAISPQLLHGGKRLRPLLLLLCAAGPDGIPPGAVARATAVEQIHLASLIHDDLLDDSPERRGMQSVPAAVGSRRAVLAGDLLAAGAYGSMIAAEAAATRALTDTVYAMTQAQAQELSAAGKPAEEDLYWKIIGGKTAALFGAAAYLGGALAYPEADARQLQAFAHRVGLAFQVCDDLLDLFGDSGQVGKPLYRDLLAGTYTLPVLYAARRDPALGRSLEELRGAAPAEAAERAREIAAVVEESGGRAYAEQRMQELVQEATSALPQVFHREALAGFAGCMISRDY
jgi:geranylgeranyl pyrophosphate synthase